ncbi:hypothetical protein BJF85_22220 [Saccharomonospora sp. CUA-673]|nr:hypothetical protein BJF85_22220 [Saccharomonospora sp. CUA-673]
MALVACAVLAGCSGPDAAGGDTPDDAEPVHATRVIPVYPFARDGDPAAGLDVVDEGEATCWQSWVSVDSDHARRCAPVPTGDPHTSKIVHDPCYVRPDEGTDRALCLADPTRSQAVAFDVVQDDGPRPAEEKEPKPWFLELGDGRQCVLFLSPDEGVDPAEIPTYACGQNDYLYGAPDTRSPVWTMANRHGEADTRIEPGHELDEVQIRTAWL